MQFILPFPPSVNTSYNINKGKRVKGAKVKEWEIRANIALNKQNILPINQRCYLIYSLNTPDNRIRDCGNYEKTLTDFLVSKGILQDDNRRYIKGILTQWNDIPGNEVHVFVYFNSEDIIKYLTS